jgi:hypothetical protein
MKQKFILITILFLVISFVLVGCKKEKQPDPEEYNALGTWVDGGDSVYTITENSTTKLVFAYAKGTKPNATMSSPKITKDLSAYQTLVISLEGSGSIMIELVNKAGAVIKVSLNVPASKGTYEWNLKPEAEFMKTFDQVRITGSPGKESSIGNVTISTLLFKEQVASGFIISKDYTDIVEKVHEYTGVAGDWHFNSKWHCFNEEENVYTISEEGTKTVVEVNKTSNDHSWAMMQVLIKGDFSKYNFAVLKVKGDAGKQILLKIRDNPAAEQMYTFTGEEQLIHFDFSTWTASEKKALDRVMLFVLPGSGSGTADVEINDVYLTDKFTTGVVKNNYNGTDEEFAIENWYDNGDSVYVSTMSAPKADSVVSYTKTENTYPALVSHIVGNIAKFDLLEVVVTGTKDKTIMVKLEGTGKNYEFTITFDGTKQVVKMDLFGQLTEEQRSGIKKVIIFAEPGTANVNGEFTIHSMTFKVNSLDINNNYNAGTDGVYTITENQDGSVSVVYDKGVNGWANFFKPIADVTFNTMKLTLKGPQGVTVLVKVNDQKEQRVELKGTEAVNVELNLQKLGLDKFTELRFFVAPDTTEVTGTLTLEKAELVNKPQDPVPAGTVVDVNKNWVDKDNKGIYTFNYADGKVVVNYNKTAGTEWNAVYTEFVDILSNHNALTMTVKGTAGTQIIIKANNGRSVAVGSDNNSEHKLTLDGTEQTVVFRFTESPKDILIFVEYEKSVISGSFEILSAKVTTEVQETETNNWVDGGDKVYTITKNEETGKVTVAFDKGSTEWSNMRIDFKDPLYYSDTVTMVVKGTNGQKILIKPNDDGQFEFWHTFNGNEQTVVVPYVGNLSKIILMAEGGTKEVTGTFEIVSTKITYEANPYQILKPHLWKQNDEGTYAFSFPDNKLKIDYTHGAGKEYTFFSHIVAPRALPLDDYDTITIVLTGKVGTRLLIKPNDAFEEFVDFTGSVQTITIDLTGKITAPLGRILLFAEPGVAEVNGSITIESFTVSKSN